MNNIYFDKIKAWTISIFILIILMLLMYLPIPYLKDNFYTGYLLSSLFYIYILFVILYRPAFLNKSSMKISFCIDNIICRISLAGIVSVEI